VSRRAKTYAVTVLLGVGSALVIPQLGWASSGGGALGGSSPKQNTTSSTRTATVTTTTGVVQQANYTARASGNGVSLASRVTAMLNRGLSFSGRASSADAGKVVEIQRRGHQTGWRWANTAHGTVDSNGTFRAYWPANHIGQFDFRAVVELSDGTTQGGLASGSLSSIVYRPAIATYYGSGFYGSQTACNVRLTPRTLGTANRTLPCGTKVAVYYGGKMIVVPVIDRGPYANHADWDLTEATASKLGTPGIANVGAVSLPSH
jgi:peptidoglycan lytic transglycosylase